MAKCDAEDPLLEQVEPLYCANRSDGLMKRRYRRCKTSPKELCCLLEDDHIASVHPPEFAIDNRINFKLVFFILLAYIGAGAVCFYLVRDQIKGHKTDGIVDAIYLCIVTMTTVGYGDLVPDGTMAKVLACVFVFVGVAIVGFFISKAADHIVENQEILLVKAIHMRDKCSPVEILKEVETNKAKYKFFTSLLLLLTFIILGTAFLYQKEGLDLFDAFYCVCATITTLGYGDKSFSTHGGRIFAAFWIFMSTICMAQFFYSVAELFTEKRRQSLAKWVLSRQFTISDLEAADLDHDKAVSASEFVVYKLKEMGKISEEDISAVMELFKILDVDHSGTLTTTDLGLANA